MKRFLKHLLLNAIACVSFSFISYGQDSTSTQKQTLSYYKIEVGIVVDCPVLPMRLQEKLMGLKGAADYKKDRDKQSIFFNVPEGIVTKEQVTAITVSCGFPAQLVNVLVDNKPFAK